MKVNDTNMIHEISKHLPRSSQNDTQRIEGRQRVDGQKIQDSEQLGQDAIVDFSPELQTAQTIRDIIASEPDVREDMVAKLKVKIEAGRYHINHKAIADKLVDSHIEENL